MVEKWCTCQIQFLYAAYQVIKLNCAIELMSSVLRKFRAGCRLLDSNATQVHYFSLNHSFVEMRFKPDEKNTIEYLHNFIV